MPELMHLVLGDREQPSFRYREFDAYVRRVRNRLLRGLAAGAEPPYPYPYPVEHCVYCGWWRRCTTGVVLPITSPFQAACRSNLAPGPADPEAAPSRRDPRRQAPADSLR